MVTCKINRFEKKCFKAVDFPRLCHGCGNVVKVFYFTCNRGFNDCRACLIAGEYWLQKAQSDNDVLAVCGMVQGTYLPRRTSQRRINNAVALSLDSATSKHYPHHYSPFLSPTESLRRDALRRPSGKHQTDAMGSPKASQVFCFLKVTTI